jgi:membrane-bound serine protease (ClpP class)
LIFAIVLLGLGFCLVVLEVFVPSGGILSILAVGSVAGGIYLAFQESATAGGIFIATAAVGLPILIYEMLKLFPKTSVGRRVILSGPSSHEEVATSSELKLKKLEGKMGTAKSRLRPSGVAEFEGERVDVVTEGMIIEPGTRLKVIEVKGNRVVVREAQTEDV